MTRLLGVMVGRGFDDRRDTAIVRLFLDTGLRLSKVAGLGVTDVILTWMSPSSWARDVGLRACPFGDKDGASY